MKSSVGLLVVFLPSLLSAQTPKSQQTGAHTETLAYYFTMVDADSAVLRLHWGTTVVPMRIRMKLD